MEIPSLFIFTHDSIGVGEDGPTHEPIEQLASLRAMPNLIVLRPGDANEVVEAWKIIAQLQSQPVALVLTRQPLPTLDRTKYSPASGTAKGGYVLADAANGKPSVILIGTGSEVSLCIDAYEKLKAEGIQARVVSIPSWGNGFHLRLGTLCWSERKKSWHAPVWRICATERFAEIFWLHSRNCGRRGPRSH
jgi:transketolase